MSEKIKLIIDTDPGQDDAAALLMAFGLENLGLVEILGITCVAGNTVLANTQKNTRIICDWAGRNPFPVYAGCQKPLLKQLITAEEVHGKTGLDGTALHEPLNPLATIGAVEFLSTTLSNATPASITLCTIGPLTNIALALSLHPECLTAIKEIIIMGGNYFTAGNVTPSAEFNFFVDPIAAQIVIQSGVPMTIIPLDVTHKACITSVRMNALRQLANQNGQRLADILQSYERYDIQNFGLEGGPLHDPCAIACCIRPDLFTQKKVHLAIETNSGQTEGACVVDWYGKTDYPANVLWSTDINADEFYQLLTEAIASLP